MNALVLTLTVLSGIAVSDPAATAGEVWITIDREVLMAFETGAEPAAAEAAIAIEDPLSIRPDIIAARLDEEQIEALSSFIHERYRRCAGFMAHSSREEAFEAAARAARSEEVELSPAPIPYTIDNGPVVRAMIAEIQELNIRNTITSLSDLFFTRRHNCQTGRDSALWIQSQWQALALGRPDVAVQLFNHTYPTLQPSVILTIQGTTLPSEVVVLGGHQDSTAGSNCATSRAPGADDDASGIASITEVIRAAMALGYQPQRTVKFMAYAAEEAGLLGSQEIAQQHQQQSINVVGVIQFDMTNYRGTPGADIVFFTNQTNAAQNAFVTELANVYVPFAGVFPRTTTAGCSNCSDHAAWHNRGFVASFPFESTFSQSNPFIHTQNDTIAQSGGHARHAVPFAKLGAAYMAELAKGGFTARPEGVTERKVQRRKTDVKAARGGRKDVGR